MKIQVITTHVKEHLSDEFCVQKLVDQSKWLDHCYTETLFDQGITLVALDDNERPVGFISVLYTSSYPSFVKDKTPEIHGLSVLVSHRRQGIAKALLEHVEIYLQKKGYTQLGLGVGITKDYQPAFNLYIQSGYLLDGKGLYHINLPHEYARYGDTITIDNSTTLWLIKTLCRP